MSFFFRRKCRIFVHFFQWILVECAGSAEDFLYFLKDRPGVNVVRDSPSHRRGSPERFRGQVCNRCVAALPPLRGLPPPPCRRVKARWQVHASCSRCCYSCSGWGPPPARRSPRATRCRGGPARACCSSPPTSGQGTAATVDLLVLLGWLALSRFSFGGWVRTCLHFLDPTPPRRQEADGHPSRGGGLQFFRSFHNSTEIF